MSNPDKDSLRLDSFCSQLLAASPSMLLVLDENRTAVFVSSAVMEFLGHGSEEQLIGLLPGDILGCVHVGESEGGCGTHEACQSCGAMRAFQAGKQGQVAVEECRISSELRGESRALDLEIHASPIHQSGRVYTVLTLKDISEVKRRDALERAFFHDVLNSAGLIRELIELIVEDGQAPDEETLRLIHRRTLQIVDEIRGHRILLDAERGDLLLYPRKLQISAFLGDLAETFGYHKSARGKTIALSVENDSTFEGDETLLRRVVGNMVKNALEASERGSVITIGGRRDGETIELWVHNPSLIPREARHHIFKRSFSTKGSGRGLGTYSMRLLSRAMYGSVDFKSGEKLGTTFFARFPLQLRTPDKELSSNSTPDAPIAGKE